VPQEFIRSSRSRISTLLFRGVDLELRYEDWIGLNPFSR
jgi:hypothetical protein